MDKFLTDGHKLYWHLDRVLEWQEGNSIAPVYVEVSPVSCCNHDCIFCGIDFARQENYSLDADVLCKRLREMASLGVRSVMFAGEGEPLLHPDLGIMVREAKRNGIDVAITTNGTVGDENLWAELLPSLSWVRFSIDAATQKVFSNVHNVPEEQFLQTIESLQSAIRVKRQLGLQVTIGVQYLLIRENLEDVEEAAELYPRLGVDYLSFKPYSEHPQMIRKSGFNYDASTIHFLDTTLAKHAEQNSKIIFRKAALSNYETNTKGFTCCHALPFWGYISSKGDFYTCSVFLHDERFRVGNITEDDMEEIFHSERRRNSIELGKSGLDVGDECRVNCRMARVNEFLNSLTTQPEHINFI